MELALHLVQCLIQTKTIQMVVTVVMVQNVHQVYAQIIIVFQHALVLVLLHLVALALLVLSVFRNCVIRLL